MKFKKIIAFSLLIIVLLVSGCGGNEKLKEIYGVSYMSRKVLTVPYKTKGSLSGSGVTFLTTDDLSYFENLINTKNTQSGEVTTKIYQDVFLFNKEKDNNEYHYYAMYSEKESDDSKEMTNSFFSMNGIVDGIDVLVPYHMLNLKTLDNIAKNTDNYRSFIDHYVYGLGFVKDEKYEFYGELEDLKTFYEDTGYYIATIDGQTISITPNPSKTFTNWGKVSITISMEQLNNTNYISFTSVNYVEV